MGSPEFWLSGHSFQGSLSVKLTPDSQLVAINTCLLHVSALSSFDHLDGLKGLQVDEWGCSCPGAFPSGYDAKNERLNTYDY